MEPQEFAQTTHGNSPADASRAARQYWDSLWGASRLPPPIDIRDRSFFRFLKYQANFRFHSMFKEIFDEGGNSNSTPLSLIELGCACSTWLPYFAKEYGFRVAGIDYSFLGCEQARNILTRQGVDGEIILGDIFQPPVDLLNRFNCAVSFGLIEHFPATAGCLEACARYLKTGGKMITIIPNMKGLVGFFQRVFDNEVYQIHVPLDENAVRRGHEDAGLYVLRCEYFCFANFGVLNAEKTRRSIVGSLLFRALMATSALTWIIESMGLRLPANKLTSPYIICVSEKRFPT